MLGLNSGLPESVCGSLDPQRPDLSHAAVRAYLDLPEEEGGCRREAMKIRDRDPWYRVPIPEPFDGFLTGYVPGKALGGT